MGRIKKYNRGAVTNQALTIKQVGARPVRVKGRQMFRLGGGVFSRREILQSRLRFGRAMGVKAPRKSVGL